MWYYKCYSLFIKHIKKEKSDFLKLGVYYTLVRIQFGLQCSEIMKDTKWDKNGWWMVGISVVWAYIVWAIIIPLTGGY